MATNQLSEELLNDLGEEFAQRLRRGEHPSVSEYSSKYPPNQADEIAEFLESIAMLEDLKGGDAPTTKTSGTMPDTFGRYQIERTLGEGGMGAVYLAHDSQLNRKVALKTPKFAKKSDSNLIDRFYREARSAATLQHPNICPVYDVGEIDGIHYISMAYIEGHSLSEYLKSKELPPIAATVRVVRKVAIALHEAHSQGVVHRDLKPANIMIDRHNEPIVMDFGLARQFGDEEDEFELVSNENAALADTTKIEARLTQDGTILGSPGYMSPEQISGKYGKIGPASDVYALGVLLYELLTGELPFRGDGSLLSIITAVITNDAPDATVIRRGLDPELAAICRKAMAKRAEDRYESMQAFAAALTSYLKSETDAASSITIPDVGPNESAALVRAKEQCELARSLYQEGQYAASVSILEKMVSEPDAESNQYIEWAASELPKVRAKAQEPVSAVTPDDGFWNQGFSAAAVPTAAFAQTSTFASPESQSAEAMPRWFYPVVAVPIVVIGLLVAAVFARSFLRGGGNGNETAQDSTSTPIAEPKDNGSQSISADTESNVVNDSARPDHPRPAPFDNGPRSPLERLLRQIDSNNDGKLSKAELDGEFPEKSPARRLAANFDDLDRNPQDGFLDEGELRRVMKEQFRKFGPDKRRPDGRGPPRRD